MNRHLDALLWWLAYRLPRRLAYFAAIRVIARATQAADLANTHAPAITVDEILRNADTGVAP